VYTEWNQGAENRAHRHANFGLAGRRPLRSTRGRLRMAGQAAYYRGLILVLGGELPPDHTFYGTGSGIIFVSVEVPTYGLKP